MKHTPPRYSLLLYPSIECSCNDKSRRFDCHFHQQRLSNNPKRSNRLIPLDDWEKVHGTPSTNQLWEYFFNADTNGFSKVINIKINRPEDDPIYQERSIDAFMDPEKLKNFNIPEETSTFIIHEGKFFRWLEKQKHG